MGSPLGPLLADCFMAKLENSQLSQTIDHLDIYKRYVDNTFVICNNNVIVDDVLFAFKNCHPYLQFTIEKEPELSIPFLDVCLSIRNERSLKRSIHRERTWNG
ncbi:unnamed protein product [Trichobilharzia szidati]|nr:unnamed protein product [Trichobilharzia szidati]